MVTDSTGRRLSFGAASVRNLSKFISAATLGLGFAMAGWTSKRQALHDMLSDAVVVLGQSAGSKA
jgi:uncharacterized RDD family membrane protein YckC